MKYLHLRKKNPEICRIAANVFFPILLQCSRTRIGCISDWKHCSCVRVRADPCVCVVCICAAHLCKRQFLSLMNKSALSAFSQMITKCILPLPDSSLIIKGRFGCVDRCGEPPTATRLGWTLGVFSSRQNRRLRRVAAQLENHLPNCLWVWSKKKIDLRKLWIWDSCINTHMVSGFEQCALTLTWQALKTLLWQPALDFVNVFTQQILCTLSERKISALFS